MALTKVSTDGVKDDAITSGKIPANAVGASELADNAVDTNAIANNAVTAGKTSGVQTTITNNADNRVITGSGTANTLNAEGNATFDGQTLRVDNTSANPQFHLTSAANGLCEVKFGDANDTTRGNIIYRNGTAGDALCFNGYNNTERMRLDSSGQLLIGGTTLGAAGSFGIEPNGHVRSILESGATGDTLFGAISGVSNGFQVNISGTNVQRYSFHNGSTVTARIDSDGLKFMNDTAAANALDDYEFGTFTPTFRENNTASNTSYNWRYGEYTKIGRLVHCRIAMGLSAFSGNFSNAFLGIPFTAFSSNGNSTFEYVPVLGYTYASGFGDSGSSENLFMEIYGHNVNSFRIVKGNGKNNVSQNDINSGQRIAISFIYTSGG